MIPFFIKLKLNSVICLWVIVLFLEKFDPDSFGIHREYFPIILLFFHFLILYHAKVEILNCTSQAIQIRILPITEVLDI